MVECQSWVKRVASRRSRRARHVRFTSNNDRIGASQKTGASCQEATSARSKPTPSFNHFICANKQFIRYSQPKRLGSSEIDHEFKFDRFLDRKFGGFRTLQDFFHINRRAAKLINVVRCI